MTGFKIISSEEALPERPLFIVGFGLPGTGKTSLSFTMPGPCLHFDFDKGISRAEQKIRPNTVAIDKYAEFRYWFYSDKFEAYITNMQIKTVIADTVGTMLEDYMIPWLIKENPKNSSSGGSLSLAGWGALGAEFNKFKARLQSLGIHVFCVCHGKEQGDDGRQMRLAVKGGSNDILYRTADLIGYVFMKSGERWISFNPSEFNIGKNTAKLPPLQIPNSKEDEYDSFMSDQVVRVCLEQMKEQSEAQVEFNKTMDTWRATLEECNKLKDFDQVIEDMKSEESDLVKAQVKKLLGDALKEKGFFYNKDSGKVEVKKEEEEKETEKTEA